jgi:hypothetical protein
VSVRKEILEELEPLFAHAEREKLWFYCGHQDQWLSPGQLRALHKEGRFIWGPANWSLRDPEERVREAERELEFAARRLAEVKKWRSET